MSSKERRRLEVLAMVRDGKLTVMKAGQLLKLSTRQLRRVCKRYREQGDKGLVHGLRGKASNHAICLSHRAAVLEQYCKRYRDFGPTLAAEKMASEEGLEIGRQTLWRWLLKEGLWTRQMRRKKHRGRRERRSCLGEMVQMDGSHHDWFEGRGDRCVLMVMIDDATGRTYARFFQSETTAAAMEIVGRYARKYGLPQSLYVDRDSIYRGDRQATVEEELRAAPRPSTQFGRAMEQLEVELILANSPQAKGRVERMNGTLQDRLVKELRLKGISDIKQANVFLDKQFLPALNRKFAVPARQAGVDVHRSLVGKPRLEEVLCFEEKRKVSNDWCVQWRNRIFQLPQRHEALALAGREVSVREKLDGCIELLSQGHKLHWKELKQRPVASVNKPVISTVQHWKPGPNHPWNRESAVRALPRARTAPATPARSLHAATPAGVTVLLQQKP